MTWPAAILLGSVLGLALRMVLFVVGIMLLRAAGSIAPPLLDRAPLTDPVYTRALVHDLGDVQIQGVAIGGAPGDALHALWPALVVDPARSRFALVRIALEPGSALVGRMIAADIAHTGVVGLGVLVLRFGWRRRRATLMLVGASVQVQAVLSVLGAQPAVRELESTGMAFAVNALAPWLWHRGLALADVLAAAPRAGAAAMLVGCALLLAYLPAAILVALRSRARAFTIATIGLSVLMSSTCAGAVGAPPVTSQSATLASITTSAPKVAESHPRVEVAAAYAPLLADRWYLQAAPTPSHVEVRGGTYSYQLLVNGQPQVIKGMGLNTRYTQIMTAAERAARLDADMAAYRELGVNTVLGWDPAEFDDVLMDAAQRHRIGVIVPFDLDPEADYTDPELRQALDDQVMIWVAHNRNHPALRMWGLGNEVLHKIVHPAWVGPQDPRRELNAEAFSDWLVETADAIHAVDPDHPVTYRSAEDAFVPWIADALRRHSAVPRPWFVLGTNCYQNYLSKIVDNWPDSGMDTALWVSEFAPGTLPVPDRPDGFREMWRVVRRHPEWVLGGAVYAWTRNGPEGVDRNFGLTDDGVPVDGKSLDMLGQLFNVDDR